MMSRQCRVVCRRAVVVMGFAASCWSALSGIARADQMFQAGGRDYLLVTTGRTWADAASDAALRDLDGRGGQLLRIDDATENAGVTDALLGILTVVDFFDTLAPDGGGGAYVWLGATDRATEGQWIWDTLGDGTGDPFWSGDETGSSVGGLYSNWGTTLQQNEPDDFQNSQDGGALSLNGWPLGSARQWNDVALNNELYYVVEFAPVPEPTLGLITIGMGLAGLTFVRRRSAR